MENYTPLMETYMAKRLEHEMDTGDGFNALRLREGHCNAGLKDDKV